jgi:hypothetical protein
MVAPTVSARPVNCGHWRPGQPYQASASPADLARSRALSGAAHLREHAAAHRHHVPRRPHPRPRPARRRRTARQSSYRLRAVSVWESIGMFRSPARCGLSRPQGIPVSAGNRIFDRTGWRTGNRAGSLIPAKRAANSLRRRRGESARGRGIQSAAMNSARPMLACLFLVRELSSRAGPDGGGVAGRHPNRQRRRGFLDAAPAACEHVGSQGKTSPRASSPALDGSGSGVRHGRRDPGKRQVAVLVWKCLNFQIRRSHERAVPGPAVAARA